MEKQLEHISLRCTPELKSQIEAIALARGDSVSHWCNAALTEAVEREHRLYLDLSRAFAGLPGLPRASDTPERPA